MAIDTHAHYFPPRLVDALEAEGASYGISLVKHPPACQCALHFEHGLELRPFPGKLIEETSARLSAMDRTGIERQVLSTWADAFGYGLPREKCVGWHRRLNQAMATLAAEAPGRFSFLASVPLPHAGDAAEALRYAVTQLGAVGAVVCANVEGRNLGDFALDEFWSAAVELNVGVLIHPALPQQTGPQSGERSARFGLAQIAQYTYDTTLCVGSLIFTGVLDRFPTLRLLLCHGGGTYPYLAGRFDIMHQRTNRAALGNVAVQKPSEYLNRFYYDTILHSPATLRYLTDSVGLEQVVLGSDYSFPPADEDPLATMRATFTVPEAEMVVKTNPRRLFPHLPV